MTKATFIFIFSALALQATLESRVSAVEIPKQEKKPVLLAVYQIK